MPLLQASLAQSHGSKKDLGVFLGLVFVVVLEALFAVVSLHQIESIWL